MGIIYLFLGIKRVYTEHNKDGRWCLYMFNRCSRKEKCRVFAAHTLGLLVGGVLICTILACRKKRTPAEKIKRAFKELEEKLEV